eukprot:TRINITY_DN27605_c0_g1_i1.p1 TRINITY_DN27605_c0_g1~~TRINITY_DN27605_c0_g1_i1.p1  ORF type:complete len:177 (+),score=30.03 TRINITY_DN27605_c0_g1_i1:63-593(+)
MNSTDEWLDSRRKEGPGDGVEIGKYATWAVSTAKHGNGVHQLRDGNEGTFWQSDGTQPHLIDVQWNKTMKVTCIGLCLEYSIDESYTPKKIILRAGNTYHDLQDISTHDLTEPEGWIWLPTTHGGHCTYASLVQIAIQENHQNGRDTHIRQVKVMGPPLGLDSFSTLELSQHATLR